MSPIRKFFVGVALVALAAPLSAAGSRIPGEHWMRYADPADAGFDPARLEAAHETWKSLPSSAFLVVADGAVVAAWGEVDRRFMCHSVRKSFLSALYGIYYDRGEIELNKRLSDLGLDDDPEPLLPTEKEARILDLLKARSGVFHPAAYAGRTDSRPRGSEGPGRYFAYNNWDFNTLAAILKQETGAEVFADFDRFFAAPLGMEDWRLSDGYYHYERDKSKYPAYPFRLSARDAARFGLLFAREGLWGERRILSRNWVRMSTAQYSIDNDVFGYGFMWWVLREPRFEPYHFVSALGVGNQMIAVSPDRDLVIVNRANTYEGESTPTRALLDLVEQVVAARTGAPAADPGLVRLEEDAPDPWLTSVPAARLAEFTGEWPLPPAPLGAPQRATLKLSARDGHLIEESPLGGTFELYLQPDGTFREEDSRIRNYAVRDAGGRFAGISEAGDIARAALAANAAGDRKRASSLLEIVAGDDSVEVGVARALADLLDGKRRRAERALAALESPERPAAVDLAINSAGYLLLGQERAERALTVFELNTRLHPGSANAWDSLGEAHMNLGHDDEAIRCYEKSLELNPRNDNARGMIERIRGGAHPAES